MVVLTGSRGNIERSGWRDERISARHRTWGSWATAVDIDFVLIESTIDAEPKALIEYKDFHATSATHFQVRLLRNLANAAGIPAFLALYWPDIWAFQVTPQNAHARTYLRSEQRMSERQYVALLRDVRGVDAPLPSNLNDEMPPRRAA